MSTKSPYTVTLTIEVGTRRYVRAFAVTAPNARDAAQVAEHRMPSLPITDPVHSESDGQRLDVIDCAVVEGHHTPAWHWDGGWGGALSFR